MPIASVAKSLGLSSLKIAAVVGDDVLDACKDGDLPIMEFDGSIKQLGNRLLSANAYLGAEPMARALSEGADVVITGRASDPALFLAPMIHAFGWAMDDWNLLGQGTVAGHLLECAGQITGGYFADPGYKDISGLARLGFPAGKIPAVVEAIRTHQPKDSPTTVEGIILRDADILEQLGAVTILRTTCKVGRDTRFKTFPDVLRVLEKNAEVLPGQLKLATSQKLAGPRLEVLKQFLAAAKAEGCWIEE